MESELAAAVERARKAHAEAQRTKLELDDARHYVKTADAAFTHAQREFEEADEALQRFVYGEVVMEI